MNWENDEAFKLLSQTRVRTYFHGREKRRGVPVKDGVLQSKTFFQINSDLCENCHACVEMTGCPGLTKTGDAYGDKIMIDPQICVADSYCTKIKACPSFEEVTISQYHPVKFQEKKNTMNFDHLPEVEGLSVENIIANKQTWRAVVLGVGGSG